MIHFDSHLVSTTFFKASFGPSCLQDTWAGYPGTDTPQSRVTHGTFFYLAHEEGLLTNQSSHVGIRCKLGGLEDLQNDEKVGFSLITTDDVDELGIPEVIKRIRDRVADTPVYLSLDIDVLDPSVAPGTGTIENGGLTARELKRILRGLAGLNFIGADLVEVSAPYDTAEITGIVAADHVHDFLSLFLSDSPPRSYRELKRDEL